MDEKKKWPGLKSIGLARNTIQKEDRTVIEDSFSKSVRAEWGVENNLHAPLDIVFKEMIIKLLKKIVQRT